MPGPLLTRYLCSASTTSEGKTDTKTSPKSDNEKGKGDNSGSSKTGSSSSKKDVRGGVS